MTTTQLRFTLPQSQATGRYDLPIPGITFCAEIVSYWGYRCRPAKIHLRIAARRPAKPRGWKRVTLSFGGVRFGDGPFVYLFSWTQAALRPHLASLLGRRPLCGDVLWVRVEAAK